MEGLCPAGGRGKKGGLHTTFWFKTKTESVLLTELDHLLISPASVASRALSAMVWGEVFPEPWIRHGGYGTKEFVSGG